MKKLKFAIFGTGFWARFQLGGWRELEGNECVALYNRTLAKAEKLGREFGVAAAYDDAERLLDAHRDLDFIDIITDVDTHARFTEMAAARKLPVICQKPMAPDLAAAERMLQTCRMAGVPLLIHENFRWQTPVRKLKEFLNQGRVGKPWRARVIYNCSFPVFENQPFLKELEQFILTDMGTHILDTARFLFGEPETLFCHTHRVNPTIKGEDAATVMMKMANGLTVSCEISYASRLERERFPQTFVIIEGEDASLELAPDYWVRVTDKGGTWAGRFPPPYYPWADSRYEAVHASIVDCNRNFLNALQGSAPAETTGEDNLKTLRLVYAAYDSAKKGQVVAV